MAFDGEIYDNIYDAESHSVPLCTARNLMNSDIYVTRVVEAKAFGWLVCIIFDILPYFIIKLHKHT